MSEFGEPWSVKQDTTHSRECYGVKIHCREKGVTVLAPVVNTTDIPQAVATAERVVACVNACRGIPTWRLLHPDIKLVPSSLNFIAEEPK